VRIVCPICKKVLEDATPEYESRPFCSSRCKQIDLGNWLDGKYRISRPLRPDDATDEEFTLN
jgi:endogenous inhibitor of DNA gyrase (YacG/DUF329 family)